MPQSSGPPDSYPTCSLSAQRRLSVLPPTISTVLIKFLVSKPYKVCLFRAQNTLPDNYTLLELAQVDMTSGGRSTQIGIKYTSRRTRKVHVKDIKRALKGHMRDGYTFNPEYKMSKESPHYNSAPTLNDKVHALVFIIDANTESLKKPEVVETIWDVRDEASDLGIPQVVIFTKIDEACPEIKRDVKNVYTSKLLQKKMHQFSADVGIPMNCIFAVKNYHEEMVFSTDANTLILSVLRRIINFAEDFFNNEQD